MTKILNFALKIKGVVGRVAHAKSSDPATTPKFGTCTWYRENSFCSRDKTVNWSGTCNDFEVELKEVEAGPSYNG